MVDKSCLQSHRCVLFKPRSSSESKIWSNKTKRFLILTHWIRITSSSKLFWKIILKCRKEVHLRTKRSLSDHLLQPNNLCRSCNQTTFSKDTTNNQGPNPSQRPTNDHHPKSPHLKVSKNTPQVHNKNHRLKSKSLIGSKNPKNYKLFPNLRLISSMKSKKWADTPSPRSGLWDLNRPLKSSIRCKRCKKLIKPRNYNQVHSNGKGLLLQQPHLLSKLFKKNQWKI